MITIHELPALRLLLSLVIGIVCAPYISATYLQSLIFSGLFVIALSCVFFFIRLKYNLRGINSILQILTGAGISYFLITLASPASNKLDISNQTTLTDKQVEYVATCIDPPGHKNSWQITMDLKGYATEGDQKFKPVSGKIIVYSKDLSDIPRPGETFRVKTKLTIPKAPEHESDFDFATYLNRKGISRTGFVNAEDLVKVGESPWWNLKNATMGYRDALIKKTKLLIGDNEAADVSAGLLFGYRDDIDASTENLFVRTGAVHLLAVSGMHVILIFSNLKSLLRLFRFNKFLGEKWMSLLAIFLIWIFTFLAGLAPSIVRATIMLSLLVLGELFKKSANSINIVSAGAVIMLIYDPMTLYDVGFQLSFAAVIGIIQLQAPVRNNMPAVILRSKTLTDLISVTIAAQIGTLPLILFYFHQFPVYFIITGIVAVIISDWIIKLGSILLLISFVSMKIASYFSLAWLIAVQALIKSIEWINMLPGGLIEGIYFDLPMAIIVSALIVVYIINRYKPIRYLNQFAISGILLVLVFDFISLQASKTTEEITTYSIKKNKIYEIKDGLNATIIADQGISDEEINKVISANHIQQRIKKTEIIRLDSDQMAEISLNDKKYTLENKLIDQTKNTIVLENK